MDEQAPKSNFLLQDVFFNSKVIKDYSQFGFRIKGEIKKPEFKDNLLGMKQERKEEKKQGSVIESKPVIYNQRVEVEEVQPKFIKRENDKAKSVDFEESEKKKSDEIDNFMKKFK